MAGFFLETLRRQREETQVLIVADSEKARPLPTTLTDAQRLLPGPRSRSYRVGQCLLLKYDTALLVTRQSLTIEGGQN